MASTRNCNQRGDYKMEQRQNDDRLNYLQYENFGKSNNVVFPDTGINMGGIHAQSLSDNSCDIESALFGINSTNLENPRPELTTQLKPMQSHAFFERPTLVMPKNFVQILDQRPMYLS